MNSKDMQAVADVVRDKDRFLITAHVKPEGDSIGSQLAFNCLLRSLGKKTCIVNQDDVPDNMMFLKGADEIKHELPDGFQPEVIVFLDCPVVERVGSVVKDLDEKIFTVNIDHHVSNEYYCDVNWVEKEISSVGEMVYHLINMMGCDVDNSAFDAIYTAIITDTGMFNYDNTSSDTHKVVAEILNKGVVPSVMFGAIYEQKSIDQVRVLGKVLGSLKMAEDGKIAYICLTKGMLEEDGIEHCSTEDFINYPRSIKGVEVAVFFNENANVRNSISISFRSTGNVDVNKIASEFGGGGHKKASGCYLACPLDEAVEKAIGRAKQELN